MTDRFDRESRRRLAFTYSRLCRLLSSQGFVAVCATISMFREVHEWNRDNLARYLEVFLDVPIRELSQRNTKSLYGGWTTGREVAGLDLEVDLPLRPDLVLKNHGGVTAAASAARVLHLYNGS